jgi:hypothetical protein
MVKNILSVILGLIASFVTILIFESISHIIHPMPEGMDLNDMEAIKGYISTAPSIVFVLVILGYAIGSLVAGLISSAIAVTNKMTKAITVGGILMGLGAYNLFMIPHPIWTIIISIFVFIPCSYIGGLLGIKLSSNKIK